MDKLTIWTLHLLAIAFSGAVIYSFLIDKLSVEAFLTVASSVIGYFTAKRI
jgi:hypothetical protein